MKIKNIIISIVLLSSITYAEESMWNKVKSNTSSAWNTTKEKVSNITTEDVKDGASKGYEKTKEVSAKAWNSSKEQYNKIMEDK